MPARVAVPLLWGVNVTPVGSVPVKLNVVFGCEFRVETVKELRVPTTNVALLTLVMAGGRLTVSVKLWVAAGLTPLDAVKVSG